VLSPELREQAEELIGRYPGRRSALLPLLHLVQHQDGYVSDDGIGECAELLGLTKAEVGAVATFYTMYKRAPLGRHLVSVCTNFSCKVRGGLAVYEHLADKLGVGQNETTADGTFTLEHAECLGNCEGAPVVTVDYLNYEGLTPETAAELVDRIAAGDVPPPTRGFAPPGVRSVHHRLAGLGPLDGGPGAATSQARADDGAVPVPEAGPGAAAVALEPTFADGQEAARADAREAVRAAGKDPDDVQAEAGPRAREFPTTAPDWEPRRPAETGAPLRDEEAPGSGGPEVQEGPDAAADDEGDGGA
jgi:NADH-quinone oxidoreductase subunit E